MKRIAMHRVLAVILLLALLVALPAMAATTQVIATGNVNVRSGPGTNYTKLGQLKKDEIVNSTGTTGDWTEIEYKDGTAYVSSTYVAAVGSSGGSSSTSTGKAQATGNVNIRSGPGTNYSKLGQMKKGETLPFTSISGGWYAVEYKDGTAYVSAQYMRTVSSGGSSGGSSTTGTQMEATANVNVRSGPSTKHSKLGQLKRGQVVVKKGTSSNWVMIDYNGKTGYVRDDYLIAIISNVPTPTPTATANTTAYVTAVRSTTIRSTASASARAVGYMDAGDKVTYLGDEGLWYKVQLGGTTGYVYYADVTKSGNDTQGMTTINAYRYTLQAINYYAEASTSSLRLGTLAKEQNVYVQAANSAWAKCSIAGQTAYVQTVYLSGFGDNMTVVNETRYTLVDNTPYYTSMNASNRAGTLAKNTAVRVNSVNNTWAQCTYNSNVVYIQLVYLTDGGDLGMVTVNEYRTVRMDAVPYYLTPSKTATRAGLLNQNQSIYVNAVNDTWAKCTYANQTVYVEVNWLEAPNNNMTAVKETWLAKAARTPCYASPSAGSTVTGTLDKDEVVKVTGKNTRDGWLYGAVTDTNNKTVMVYVRIADMYQK